MFGNVKGQYIAIKINVQYILIIKKFFRYALFTSPYRHVQVSLSRENHLKGEVLSFLILEQNVIRKYYLELQKLVRYKFSLKYFNFQGHIKNTRSLTFSSSIIT